MIPIMPESTVLMLQVMVLLLRNIVTAGYDQHVNTATVAFGGGEDGDGNDYDLDDDNDVESDGAATDYTPRLVEKTQSEAGRCEG